MSHENISIMRRWFEEVWSQRREQTIDELVAGDGICHMEEGPMRGPEEFKARQYFPFVAAFPDLRVQVDGMIGDGDEVVTRWSAEGTHSGEGLGFAATGEKVAFSGISWVRLQDGKMVQGWQSSNIALVLRDLAAKAST